MPHSKRHAQNFRNSCHENRCGRAICTPEQWRSIKQRPAQAARQWAEQHVGKEKSKKTLDAWQFSEKYFKSAVLMGLIRVDKTIALELAACSGQKQWFCEPLSWKDIGIPNPGIKWLPQAKDEKIEDYVRRALDEEPKYGITRGEVQLGIRNKKDEKQQVTRNWKVQGVPDPWDQETLESVPQKDSPLQNVTCTSRTKERKGKSTWQIRAMSLPAQDFFELKFADFNIIAFVITTRAKSAYPAKQIANARTVAVGKVDVLSETKPLEIPPTILEDSQDADMEGKSEENERSKPEKHNASLHKGQQPAKRSIPVNPFNMFSVRFLMLLMLLMPHGIRSGMPKHKNFFFNFCKLDKFRSQTDRGGCICVLAGK